MTDALADKPLEAVKIQTDPKQTVAVHRTANQAQRNFAAELLAFESEVRSIKDEREMIYHLCNSCRRVVQFEQCFYGKYLKQVHLSC